MRVPRFLNGLKPSVKKFRHRARTVYINRFHSFTPADFRQMLRSLGVQPGDVLCVHSSFDQFLGFTGNLGDAIRSLQESVEPDGGILMPTQPFNTTAIEYVRTHPYTDLVRSHSRMGPHDRDPAPYAQHHTQHKSNSPGCSLGQPRSTFGRERLGSPYPVWPEHRVSPSARVRW